MPPLLKLVLKNLLAWFTKHIVEFMPGVIVFSVEVFNALYVTKCMQSAGSTTPFIAIMAFDAFKFMLTFRSMKARAQSIFELLAQFNASRPSEGFVDTVLELCQDPSVLSREHSLIRIHSPITLVRSRSSLVHAMGLSCFSLQAWTCPWSSSGSGETGEGCRQAIR